MTPNLYLTPNLDTSISHVLAQIQSAKRTNPLTPVFVLLPTADAIRALQYRLGDTANVHLYQFYRLGQALLDATNDPVHQIGDTTIRRLVHHLLGEMDAQGELTTFASVWEKPGFTQTMIDWLREMKSQGIFPEDYQAYAQQTGNERDRQLAQLYARYQAFLQARNLSDADGLLWLAAEALGANPDLFQTEGPFIVLGFDQFNPLQTRILTELAARFSTFSLYLPWETAHTDNSLALSRLRQTRRQLEANLAPRVAVLEESGDSDPVLTHLRRTLFEPGRGAIVPGDEPSIRAVEAPSREAEVRQALRATKRLLLDGVSPHQIALLAPNPEVYMPLVRTVSGEYGLPVQWKRTLRGNPAVAALLNLLNLPPDFPWRPTLDGLRSPYIRQPWLSPAQIDLLDQLSRERPVVAGREQWRFALRPLEALDFEVEDEDLGPPPLVATLPPDELAAIEQGLAAFFDHLSPPQSATHREHTRWVQTAILGLFPEGEPPPEDASLHLAACCEESPFQQRDLEALAQVTKVLEGLVESAELVPVGEGGQVPWEAYRSDLHNILPATVTNADPVQSRVRFGPLEIGRALTMDYLFVLGLSEGEFPRPPAPDPLYAPAERENHPLPLVGYTPADDASLWWQVIANCRRQITLLRPRLDENGAPWLASPYWDAVLEKVDGVEVEKIQVAAKPRLEEAASPNELLVALAAAGARSAPSELARPWQMAQNAQVMMVRRQSWDAPGVFEGVFTDPGMKHELADRFGPHYVWSASRLNQYNNCPYGFFAQSVLKLEPRPDPEEGLDPLQRGGLLHAILEELHRRLAAEGLTLSEPNREAVLAHLDACCGALFPGAPVRYGFRPGALWEYEKEELQRMLRAFVSWECDQNGPVARFSPYRQEVKFGIGQKGPPPLEIEAPETSFRLHGVIDRLDRDEAGNLQVVDYKSGRTAYYKSDIEKGLALQTALYALAAEEWLEDDGRVVESRYLHIPTRETSGELTFEKDVERNETVQAAVDRAAFAVRQTRAGVFPSAPAKPARGGRACRRRCEFASLCRVSRLSIAKARQKGIA